MSHRWFYTEEKRRFEKYNRKKSFSSSVKEFVFRRISQQCMCIYIYVVYKMHLHTITVCHVQLIRIDDLF